MIEAMTILNIHILDNLIGNGIIVERNIYSTLKNKDVKQSVDF